MNFFRKKTEEDRDSSSSSLPRDDTASVSSKATSTSTNTTSKVELVKCYIPFEQPVLKHLILNSIKNKLKNMKSW